MRIAKSAKAESDPKIEWVLATILILAFVVQALWGLKQQTATIDEFRHLPTGLYELKTHDFSFDPKTPPFWKMACALPAYLSHANLNVEPDWRLPRGGWGPWVFGTRFMMDNAARYDDYFYEAHLVTLMVAVLLILLVFGWAKEVSGPMGGLGALVLMAFSPTLLSNSRLATPDIAVTFFMTATLYLVWRYCQSPSWKFLVGAGLSLGFALITKYTAVLLMPLVPLLLLIRSAPRREFKGALIASSALLILALGIVNLQYRFQGAGMRLKTITAQSRLVNVLQKSALNSCPIPIPSAYLEGFDGQKADAETGEFPAFLNGRWSPNGWKYYYLAVLAYKEPLPFLVILGIGLLLIPMRVKGKFPEIWEIGIFWFVPATLLVVLSFFNHLDVGIRYLLPAYPFLWIFAARTVEVMLKGMVWNRLLLSILAALVVASPFTSAPFYLAYFNPLAGGASRGFEHLIDSNLDHGQELKDLKIYMDEHAIPKVQLAYFGHVWPQLYGINFEPLSDHPKPGVVAISASFLQGMPYLLTYLPQPAYVPLNYFQAMRQYQPVAQIGYSIFVYSIPQPKNP